MYDSVSQNPLYMFRDKKVNLQEVFSTADVLIINLYVQKYAEEFLWIQTVENGFRFVSFVTIINHYS